jgi:hypothetical protein
MSYTAEEKKLLAQLPGGLPPEYIHVPQPDGTLLLKRFLDCLPSDTEAHARWMREVIERADPEELEWVAWYYDSPTEREL